MNSDIKDKIERIVEEDFFRALVVWEESVRATHDFLTEEDIQAIKPLVEKAFYSTEELVGIRDSNNEVVAFMGMEKEKVEMLFIHPSCRGKGIGKKLINYAINEYNAKYVDVNEQNEQAEAFYKHIGCTVIDRSETDGMGNPFPILHMKIPYDRRK